MGMLPKDVLRMLYGLVLCFFGGQYVATLAAIEAFNALGGQKTIPDFVYVIQEFYKAWKESHREDQQGMIGSAKSTMSRTHQAMIAIKNPERLNHSIGACMA